MVTIVGGNGMFMVTILGGNGAAVQQIAVVRGGRSRPVRGLHSHRGIRAEPRLALRPNHQVFSEAIIVRRRPLSLAGPVAAR
jgi:hypothetical protein